MNNDHNIADEDNNLNGMAPKLSKLGAKHPFNPSDDYFNAFTSKLQSRIEDEEDIRSIAPTLLSIDKYSPFEVPDNYFDELPTLIQEKVLTNNTPTFRFEWLRLLFRPNFAVPIIAIVFLTVVGINYMNKKAEVINTTMLEELSLEDQLYYINETDIIEQLTADASLDVETSPEEENSIEDYLIDNNIEESKLSNEL